MISKLLGNYFEFSKGLSSRPLDPETLRWALKLDTQRKV